LIDGGCHWGRIQVLRAAEVFLGGDGDADGNGTSIEEHGGKGGISAEGHDTILTALPDAVEGVGDGNGEQAIESSAIELDVETPVRAARYGKGAGSRKRGERAGEARGKQAQRDGNGVGQSGGGGEPVCERVGGEIGGWGVIETAVSAEDEAAGGLGGEIGAEAIVGFANAVIG